MLLVIWKFKKKKEKKKKCRSAVGVVNKLQEWSFSARHSIHKSPLQEYITDMLHGHTGWHVIYIRYEKLLTVIIFIMKILFPLAQTQQQQNIGASQFSMIASLPLTQRRNWCLFLYYDGFHWAWQLSVDAKGFQATDNKSWTAQIEPMTVTRGGG